MTAPRHERLAGYGAELVRELAIAARVQSALERLYQLERVADVANFVGEKSSCRETLILREAQDGAVELLLHLPRLAIDSGTDLDTICQIIEGVSHFVYVTERARLGREATQLELELQAEVDKWVVLAASMRRFDSCQSARLRARLYERVEFAHAAQTELGERYRVANDSANRFVRRLERDYLCRARFREMHGELRRFYHLGQEEKLRLGRAA